MKKVVLAVLSVVFAAANVFAFGTGEKGEVNVKLSYDLVSSIDTDNTYDYNLGWIDREGSAIISHHYQHNGTGSQSLDLKSGITMGGEYLYPLFSRLKVGGGMQYFLARNTTADLNGGNSDVLGKVDVAYLPLYATIQVNPFAGAWYLKTNFGYNIYSKSKLSGGGISLDHYDEGTTVEKKGFGEDSHKSGSYIGIMTGWEIISSRIIIELGYEVYESKTEYSWNYYDGYGNFSRGDATIKGMTRIYLALGYKIKL
jgi:hypothetical protein